MEDRDSNRLPCTSVPTLKLALVHQAAPLVLRRQDSVSKSTGKSSQGGPGDRRARMARKPFHTSIEQVENWPARLNAMVKRLIMNRDVFTLCSIFAWGRMTVTIKHPETNETMELWKPKRVDTIALFAYIYINRESLFGDYAGYEFLFEDATGSKVTVADLGGPGVSSDFLALQQELDLHWGVHKRRLCPALRQPQLVTRPVCPAILSDLAPALPPGVGSPTSTQVSPRALSPDSNGLDRSPSPAGMAHQRVSPPAYVPRPRDAAGLSPTVPSAEQQRGAPEEPNLGMWSLIAAAEMLDRQEKDRQQHQHQPPLPPGGYKMMPMHPPHGPHAPLSSPKLSPEQAMNGERFHFPKILPFRSQLPGSSASFTGPVVRYAPYYASPKPLSARCEFPVALRVEAPQFTPPASFAPVVAVVEKQEPGHWRPW